MPELDIKTRSYKYEAKKPTPKTRLTRHNPTLAMHRSLSEDNEFDDEERNVNNTLESPSDLWERNSVALRHRQNDEYQSERSLEDSTTRASRARHQYHVNADEFN